MTEPESPSERLLAESPGFEVRSEFESVWVLRKGRGEKVVIGDMYGDPECAVIDKDGAWCVVAGHGLLVYRLCEPFAPRGEEGPSEQWSEFGSDPDDSWWVSEVVQVDERTVRFTVDAGDEHAGVYVLDVDSMTVRSVDRGTAGPPDCGTALEH